jgi:2-polyprenyl-6-methoxyphenol hydroxylase-like FAD-dependent oxidoreductase
MKQGAIIGGGIAGLAAALFAQESGMDVAVYERSKSVSCADHLLWIAPNGLHLLQRLGLADELLKASVPQEAMIFATKNLRPLMTLSGDSLRQSCDFPIVAIRRKNLWDALETLWRSRGGQIFYDHALRALETAEDHVTAHFGDQQASVQAAWVMGADGMGSKVRELVFPESRVNYQGIRTWLGRSKTRIASRHIGQTIEAWGTGTRFVLTSLDGETVYFSALERSSVYDSNAAPIPHTTLSRLQAQFSEYHCDIQMTLASADPGSLVRCNFGVVSGVPVPVWGRVVLIGDAAHGMPPNMGQGASLALEDALWATHFLAQKEEIPAAFQLYADGRERRVGEMRSLANAMNLLFQPKSRLGSRVRNSLAALVPDALTAVRMGQLYQPSVPRL